MLTTENRAKARAEQLKQFGDIAKGIDASIANSQKQFETTMSGIGKSIDTVTGGNTYCYAIASPVGSEFMLGIATVGSTPLHEVTSQLIDVDLMRKVAAGKPSLSLAEIGSFTLNFPTIPFLASSSSRTLATIPIGVSDERNFSFNFVSLNGLWNEILKLRRVDGQWAQAIKVSRVLKNARMKTVYVWAADNYPKVEGRVDWDN